MPIAITMGRFYLQHGQYNTMSCVRSPKYFLFATFMRVVNNRLHRGNGVPRPFEAAALLALRLVAHEGDREIPTPQQIVRITRFKYY